MKKRIFTFVFTLFVAAGLLTVFTTTAGAEDLTPNYYVTGAPNSYAVGTTSGGGDVGMYVTFAEALTACRDNWSTSPGTPVIQLGSAGSPLSVNRGGNLVSAIYTGAVNIEYYPQPLGLKVGADVTATMRDFTLTNSVKGSNTLAYYAIYVLSGGTLAIEDGTRITVADGTVAGAACALNNVGTVTISGNVILSIADKTYAIFNNGTCTIGGNAGDNITISTSASAGTGIRSLSGQLTIGTGTTVNAFNGLYIGSGCNAAISGGMLVSPSNTVENDGTLTITGGVISSEGTSDTACAIYDKASSSPKGVFISGTPTLKSVTPNTVRLEKRTPDSKALTYFGTSFFTNANAVVAIQGTYDEAADAYVINGDNYINAQAHALPGVGYGAPRWTSDAARSITLSTASPAAVSTLTAGGNASIYLSVRPAFAVTVSTGGYGTASASPSSATTGETVTLTTTPNAGYSFSGWTSPSGVTFADASSQNTTFTMPASQVTVEANFSANQYTVTWKSQDGTTTLEEDTGVSYNSTPSFSGSEPTKASDGAYSYAFAGWAASTGATIGTAEASLSNVTDSITYYAAFTATPITRSASNTPAPVEKTITVTETSSDLFKDATGAITVEANVEDAFSNSVEVKVTNTTVDAANFGFGAVDEVFLFDISLYIRGTDEKTKPVPGYAVTIALPIPKNLIDKRNDLSVVHKSDSGVVTELTSRLEQRNGVWYLVFEATEFSPYALVVRNVGIYDASVGVPYYFDADGSKVFIGFAANGKYFASSGVTINFTYNDKSFEDVPGHWSAQYIGFVTEREIFLGTGTATFSPDAGMTRAMFASVVGRLYERSFGAIEASGIHVFTDCDYSDYYGKYVDWAAKNEILSGYGNGKFGPNDKVTREQMAATLYRFANFLGVLPGGIDIEIDYPDAGSISDYVKTAALYCQTTGIIGGRTDGMFAPQETATRAEVATVIQRFIESSVK